jgi:hypothetical protein
MDLYYKWESLVIGQNAIGRFIDNNTPSSISTVIRAERSKAALAQTIKAEPAHRKPRATPMNMLGLGPRMKISGVGLVDSTPNLPSSTTMPRIGKVGTSRIVFECHDIEDGSLDKRTCTRHSVFRLYQLLSICDQINICTRRSQSEVGVSTICGERQLANLMPRIALDDRIDELADLVRQHYGLAELGDPSSSTDVGHFVQFLQCVYRVLLGGNCCSWSYNP